MKIDSSSENFEKSLVFLDGKLVRYAFAADDEEGWIDVPDPKSMAPLDLNEVLDCSEGSEQISEWEEVVLLRKYGKVTIKVLP